MSGSGRHSSHDGSSSGRTPSSYAYVDQTMSGQQYLRPEDVYRLEREGTYFNPTSYSQSRHASETSSPRRNNDTPPDQVSRHQSHPQSPYIEYPYTDLSRHGSRGDYGVESSRRTTPPDQSGSTSRHSPTGSHGGSPKDREQARSAHANGSPKGKGKERADDRGSDSSPRGGGGRHGSGDGGGGRSSRKGAIGPSQGRLVSGVFIRY